MNETLGAAGSGLVTGASAAKRGLAIAWGSAQVRRVYLQLVLVLVAIATALDAAGIWAVVQWTRGGDDGLWWTIAMVLLRIAGICIVLLVAPIVALFVVNGLFPFLGERVFFAGMRQIAPARADELSAREGLSFATGLFNALVRLALFLLVSVSLFVLSFVPVLGSIAGPVLQAWRTALALGWELLDPYFDKLGWTRAQQRELLRRHQAPLLGFALPFVLVMAVPIAGPFVFGLAQAAIATLVIEVIERESR
ncbi:MAG TPA: EI24 domain-containing protein [Nannocystaceae bacterium]|nr:EI24 domain-containing protein [Nannocystaceae bacterium]